MTYIYISVYIYRDRLDTSEDAEFRTVLAGSSWHQALRPYARCQAVHDSTVSRCTTSRVTHFACDRYQVQTVGRDPDTSEMLPDALLHLSSLKPSHDFPMYKLRRHHSWQDRGAITCLLP